MKDATSTRLRMIRKLSATATAAAVGSALVGSTVSAQLRTTINTPDFAQPAGPSPTLAAPAPGAHVESLPSRATPVVFSWSLTAITPPQRFMLCIAETGAQCGNGPRSVVVQNIPASQTSYQTPIAAALHDKTLEWSVAACGPGYGGGLVVAGTANADCSWSSRRALTVGFTPPLINLGVPGDSTVAPRTSASHRFTWQEPRGVAVESYRFCLLHLSDPARVDVTPCEQASVPSTWGIVASISPGRGFIDVDLRPLRQSGDRAMAWTMLICTGASCRLAANQPVRRFTIPGPLPAPQLVAPAAGALEPRAGDQLRPGGALVENDFKGPTTFPASITFEWSRVTGATGYRLCISEPGVACGRGSSVVTDGRVQGIESVPWSSLPAFHGRTVNWTVASCDALGCGAFTSPRPLTIKAVPGPVTLIAPRPGTNLTSLPDSQPVQFSWSAPTFSETFVVQVGQKVDGWSSTPSCTAPKSAFAELRGATSWTVQACNVVGCGPVSAANDITIYPPALSGSRAGTSRTSSTSASTGASVRATALTLCQ